MTDSRSRMISVKELEVVGYADVLRLGTIPRRVAPIFRYNADHELPADQARCVFPPFRLVDEFVINGTVGIESDLDSAVTARRATRLGQPISAQPSSVLWIDENLDPHYGPQREVNAHLQCQAKAKYRQAKEAFQQGQYDKARQLARWAFAADQRCWLALALQAAMRQLEGDEQAVAVTAHLAADLVIAEDFDAQVDRLAQEVSAKRDAGFAPPQQEKSEDDSEKLRADVESLRRETEKQAIEIRNLRSRIARGISLGHQATGNLRGLDKALGGSLEDEQRPLEAVSELAVFLSTEKGLQELAKTEWPEDTVSLAPYYAVALENIMKVRTSSSLVVPLYYHPAQVYVGSVMGKALQNFREIEGIKWYNAGLLFGHTLSEDEVAMRKMATSTVR